jgi:hypothetical protein
LEFYALDLLFSPVHVQNLKFIHFTFYTFHYRPPENYRAKKIFKTITLENTILPRLKPFKPLLLVLNTVYIFTCVCSETYIGHTSRLLKNRIQEHNRCKKFHVYEHIINCFQYHESLKEKYSTAPSLTQLRNHLYEHFTALSKNLPNWHERTAFEGLMITQLQPTLNKQLKYKKSNLKYICIARINDPFNLLTPKNENFASHPKAYLKAIL